jgi:hypothetical protein
MKESRPPSAGTGAEEPDQYSTVVRAVYKYCFHMLAGDSEWKKRLFDPTTEFIMVQPMVQMWKVRLAKS